MNCAKIQNMLDETVDLKDFESRLAVGEKNHLDNCATCRKIAARYREADNVVSGMRKVAPPKHVSLDYMAGLYQKLEKGQEADNPPQAARPKSRWSFARAAFAGLVILLIAFGIWRFGFDPGSTIQSQHPTSDSLEYYLESFNEVSSLNPVYVVQEMEYDWSDYENSNSEN